MPGGSERKGARLQDELAELAIDLGLERIALALHASTHLLLLCRGSPSCIAYHGMQRASTTHACTATCIGRAMRLTAGAQDSRAFGACVHCQVHAYPARPLPACMGLQVLKVRPGALVLTACRAPRHPGHDPETPRQPAEVVLAAVQARTPERLCKQGCAVTRIRSACTPCDPRSWPPCGQRRSRTCG